MKGIEFFGYCSNRIGGVLLIHGWHEKEFTDLAPTLEGESISYEIEKMSDINTYLIPFITQVRFKKWVFFGDDICDEIIFIKPEFRKNFIESLSTLEQHV